MRHVFVETNWVVDFAAPEHRQAPGARSLFDKARRRELMLHLPNLCLGEARRVLLTKFQPRGEADAIRHYVRWAAGVGGLSDGDRSVVIRVVEEFESKVRGELENLDSTFNSLRAESGIEIFPMNDRQLALSIEISPHCGSSSLR
jgi:predicted nucleic acid-binding protein